MRSFNEAARTAHNLREPHWEAKAEVYAGGALLRLFRYRAALETTESAAALAKRSGDSTVAGGAEINISTIYAQLGSFDVARQKLLEAIRDLRETGRPDLLAQAYYSLSFQQIRLRELQAGIRSSELSIYAAQQAKNAQLEATAWDFRGVALLLAHHLEEAARSLQRATDLYVKATGKAVPSTMLEHVAELKWKEKQYEAALSYIDKAFASADPSFKTIPQYYPLTVRAGILRDLGRTDQALSAYRKAVTAANLWRRTALPGDTTNIQTVTQLHDTYQSFAELAAAESLQRHSDALSREAFEALVQNQAASLREQLAQAMGQNQSLPPEYLAKLGELQNVQARVTLAGDAASESRLADLETEVAQWETKIGLRSGKKALSTENYRSRNSLRDIQSGLKTTEALFSFCLGEQQSFLWALTGETVILYKLPGSEELGKQAKALRDALEHRQGFATPANKLSKSLFSQLDAKFWNKPEWLVVGDGPLLDRVPFAVLPGASSGQMLVQGHTIRLLPSALFAAARTSDAPHSKFVGVADPLYNLADSRRSQQSLFVQTNNSRGSIALGRLPGTQREIRTSAKYSGMAESDLLIGPNANLNAVTNALSQRPGIVHFAVHVVSPPEHPEQAALALSLGEDNVPELLTREKIASLRVPGSLIVLSGCSSGQGQPAPGTGLIGLSRAWLLAGASAVVVSNWPTPDDSGQFFTIFYSQFFSSNQPGAHSGSLAQRAASALQKAQLQMQQRGGYGSAPAFWAAYSIVSKE